MQEAIWIWKFIFSVTFDTRMIFFFANPILQVKFLYKIWFFRILCFWHTIVQIFTCDIFSFRGTVSDPENRCLSFWIATVTIRLSTRAIRLLLFGLFDWHERCIKMSLNQDQGSTLANMTGFGADGKGISVMGKDESGAEVWGVWERYTLRSEEQVPQLSQQVQRTPNIDTWTLELLEVVTSCKRGA